MKWYNYHRKGNCEYLLLQFYCFNFFAGGIFNDFQQYEAFHERKLRYKGDV